MIKIHADHCFLIGDALSSVPWMKYLCDEHQTEGVVVGDFNSLVSEFLGPSYPFILNREGAAPGFYDAEYHVSVADLFGYSSQVHITQCFFKHAGKPLPALPLSLDLRCERCGVPSGVVIAPFSRSDLGSNKLWPVERWLSVIDSLRKGGQIDRIYVVGASSHDDPSAYVAEGVKPFFDQPLSKVLSLMRQAPLVMTIDTGISHLAHYGSVKSHVLLYPSCLPECWVENPYAVTVRGTPADIQPYHILQAARTVLGRPYVSRGL